MAHLETQYQLPFFHKMPLEDINKAFDLMHQGKSIRSVIEF